jgi:hypothetical protein
MISRQQKNEKIIYAHNWKNRLEAKIDQRDKEDRYILIKGIIRQEDLMIGNGEYGANTVCICM